MCIINTYCTAVCDSAPHTLAIGNIDIIQVYSYFQYPQSRCQNTITQEDRGNKDKIYIRLLNGNAMSVY